MITESQLITKINLLANIHSIKIIDGDNKARKYYQVEDLILSFYFSEYYPEVHVSYRGKGIATFKDYEHIYRVINRRMKAQIIREFK